VGIGRNPAGVSDMPPESDEVTARIHAGLKLAEPVPLAATVERSDDGVVSSRERVARLASSRQEIQLGNSAA